MQSKQVRKLRVGVLVITYNEERILPFFLQYYRAFCETIVVYDNYSTDRTWEIAQRGADIVRRYDSGDSIRDDIYLQIKDSVWKEKQFKKLDWFLTLDADEFVYADNILDVLGEHIQRGTRVLRTQGYSMFHEGEIVEGKPLIEQIQCGVPEESMRKPVVFRPSKLRATNFHIGCHGASPTDFWRRPVTITEDPRLKMLHYKYIWGFDALRDVYQQRANRLSELNKQNAWGTHYQMEKIEKEFMRHREQAIPVV